MMLNKLKDIPTKKLIMITVVTVVLIAAGAAYWFWVAAPAQGNKPKVMEIVTVGDFTTNLSLVDGLRQQVIRLSIEAEVENQKVAKELRANLPQIRDAILVTLRNTTVYDINGAAGMDSLRENLLTAVNSQLPKERVSNLLFIDLIVQ